MKVGDKVKVNGQRSQSARKLSGKVGTILEVNKMGFCVLDIEGRNPGGIWNDELFPVEEEKMSKVNYHLLGDSVVINHKARTTVVRRGDARFEPIVGAIRSGRLEQIPDMLDVSTLFIQKGLEIVNGSVRIDGDELPDSLNQRLLDLMDAQMPVDILVKFWHNLKKNPSFNSRKMLYAFLEHNGHPLTDDGCFIAYRSVREDFKDKHTGTIDNSVGNIIEMPREKVNDNPNETCSSGLHVACYDYAKGFASVLLEVKVNPADVVAVPVDYNGTKMRVCKFEVMAQCDALLSGPVYRAEEVKAKEEAKAAEASKTHSLRGPDGRFIPKQAAAPVAPVVDDADDSDDDDGDDYYDSDGYYDSY